MNRKDLSSIYHLRKELVQWTRRLQELEARRGANGSPSDMELTGVHASRISSPVEKEALDIADTQEVIIGILAQIRCKEREIIEHVDSIEDSFLRQIIMCRCFDCMPWYKVALEVGSTEDAVKKIFYRAYPK